MLQENGIRKALREGRVAIGPMIREFDTRGLAHAMDYAGCDYMMIDMEHGSYDIETIANLAGWFKATPVSPMVRIHKIYNNFIPAILDQGIMGLQVSSIESAEDARALVHESKYPPIGHRGISLEGAHTNYRKFTEGDYAAWANENVIVCAALESPEGVEHIDEIAAVPGIDMINIGHSDLSARMGIHMQLEHPRFKEVLRAVTNACKKYGKIARAYPLRPEHVKEYYELGFRCFGIPGTDIGFYRDSLKTHADKFREGLKAIGVPAA